MKKLLYLILICAFVFNSTLAQEIKNYSEKELIIKLKSDVEFDSKNCLLTNKFNNQKIDYLNKAAFVESIVATGNKKLGRTFLLKLKYNANIEQLVKDYMDTSLFEYVEPNHFGESDGLQQTPLNAQFTPNDEHYYNRQWQHYNDGTFPLSNSTADADMDTDLAWDVTQGDPNIIVAIIDSGIKMDHPEFAGREWINTDEVLDGTDTDNNGYIDDLNWGWNFVENNNMPIDDNRHGTGVAGLALANGNNGIGYAGINWNSKIMVCKVLASNGGSNVAWWADAIYYAVDNGANVINMSLGSPSPNALLEEAVNYAYDHNVSISCSIGNGNSDSIRYPSGYENTFAIGATDPDDTRSVLFDWDDPAGGSNYGPHLDFVAPGNYGYFLDYQSDTNYELHSGGTSLAAPQVTGVISLLLSINPNLTVEDIRATLIASSEDEVGDSEDTAGWDQYYGHGRINAYNAVTNIILGLEENTNLESNIIVYPNPVINDLTIENIDPGSYKIALYDLLGREQFKYSTTADGNHIKMTIPKLSSGTYFLHITETSSVKNTVTKKIIIQ